MLSPPPVTKLVHFFYVLLVLQLLRE